MSGRFTFLIMLVLISVSARVSAQIRPDQISGRIQSAINAGAKRAANAKPPKEIVAATKLRSNVQIAADAAERLPAAIRKYLAACTKQREFEIAHLKWNSTGTGPNRQRVLVKLAMASKAEIWAFQPRLQSTLNPGDIGLPEQLEVLQVLDEQNMLLDVSMVNRKVDSSLEGSVNYRVWLQGVPTVGIVDGEFLTPFFLEITGTQQYENVAGGTTTVFTAGAFDVAAAKEQLERIEAVASLRTWSDSTANFSIVARFLDHADGNVQLQRPNGEKLSVPMSRLSDDDRNWVRDKLRGREQTVVFDMDDLAALKPLSVSKAGQANSSTSQTSNVPTTQSVPPAKKPTNVASSHFVGQWRIINSKGKTATIFTLSDNLEAKKSHAPDVGGQWMLVENEARITWSDGWRDILRVEGSNVRKIGFKPGLTWNDPPTNEETAVK